MHSLMSDSSLTGALYSRSGASGKRCTDDATYTAWPSVVAQLQ